MYETILVPTDGSEGAVAAGERAVELARLCGATLHVLYVVDVRMSPVSTGMDREEVERLVESSDAKPTARIVDLASSSGVPAVEAIRVDVPAASIREYADEVGADMIVVGTHGRTGLSHALLGSVAERVVRTSDVPVTTVPTPTGES